VRLELFDYPLPPERIAQTPIEPRDAARLLVLRKDGSREHRRFLELPELLNPGDLLVFNDTRVLPARLHGRKETGARVEALLLQRLAPGRWEALVHPGRRLGLGARIRFGVRSDSLDEPLPGLTAEVVGRGAEGTRILQFYSPDEAEPVDDRVQRLGQVPLPPYIHEALADPERYQTVYARPEPYQGSAAAPTAGLHFTPRVLQSLQKQGIRFAYVTLHVGIATFRPVRAENIEAHEMHAEWYTIPEETARAVRECTGRVVAVGTTTVRCLESAALPRVQPGTRKAGGGFRVQGSQPIDYRDQNQTRNSELGTRNLQPGSGVTRLYITPGYRFRVVDCLLTNFHMPRSSLLILVSAFAGVETIQAAYRDALAQGYRFLSFGDAMFLERPSSDDQTRNSGDVNS
jgi:S-adenosylmethionine:tRNA ribosyltransferase-isomerase